MLVRITTERLKQLVEERLQADSGSDLSAIETRPGTGYCVSYRIVFGSNAQSDCAGIGGAPGESVYLKAGATDTEPLAAAQGDGSVRMNVDKGDQSSGGAAATVVGHIANGIPCGSAEPVYVSLEPQHAHTVTVTTGSNATLWLLVGTDSGFEGLTALFYQRVEVTLIPQ